MNNHPTPTHITDYGPMWPILPLQGRVAAELPQQALKPARNKREHTMKILYFDDFKLGVLKGDAVVDVSAVVKDIPHIGPGDLMNGLIERFGSYRRSSRQAAASGTGDPAVERPHPPAAAEAAHDRLHGGQLHGRRHPQRAGADQRLPQIPERDHRPRRHDGAARRAGDDLRGRGRDGGRHRQARSHVNAADAMDYIFGYINFIDGSARGLPPPGNVFFQMKSRDTFAPIGPYLVTTDEIKDPQKLQIRLWNNGALMQNFNTDDMGHKIPRCIEWLTSIHTLEPGDIIATGTNHRGLNPFMDGDKIELEIEGLGRLTFNVKDELKRTWERKTRLQMHEEAKEKTAGTYPDITPQLGQIRQVAAASVLPSPARRQSKGEGSSPDGSANMRPFAAECLEHARSRVHPSAAPQGSMLRACFGPWTTTPDRPPRRVRPQPDRLPARSPLRHRRTS